MPAQVLTIDEKVRPLAVGFIGPEDFRTTEAEILQAEVVVEQPNLSLYCLDPINGRALFVETPADVDLLSFPFLYQAQYTHAQRLVALPLAELHQAAALCPLDGRHLILLCSVGRCGSTLLTRLLNAAGGVTGLSEPDVFTQLLMLQAQGTLDPADLPPLLHSSTRLLYHFAATATGAPFCVFKPRAMVTRLAPHFHRQFPGLRILFLYRNARDWTESMVRMFQGTDLAWEQEPPASIVQPFAVVFPRLAERLSAGDEPLSMVEFYALIWLSIMEQYVGLHEQGIPLLALRYEELTAAPLAALAAVAAYWGITLPVRSQLEAILQEDSQAGSVLSRQNTWQQPTTLTTKQIDELEAVLARHPTIRSSAYIGPQTFGLSGDGRRAPSA